MIAARQRFLPLLLAVSLVLAPAPAAAADLGSLLAFDFLGGVNLVSVEQERQFGAQFAREIESKKRLVRDREIVDYVSSVGGRLVRALGKREFEYRFRVVQDPAVNAFNIGGGYVYVNSGLLATARSEGEVAAVMAHEIGHQVKRHVAKTISREQLFRSLASFAVGSKASQWVQLAAGLGITTGQLHFGREAEREADRVMVDLMTAAGYDPREALRMFEMLRAVERGQPSKVASIFSSHPPNAERASAVSARIRQRRLPPDLVRDTARFRAIRARLA